jgi:hypothetical protein
VKILNPIPSEYYGDTTRWFIATVVSSTPPTGYEGRVKIRIHGLHSAATEDIPEYALPWAQCVVPTTEGGVSGIGKMPKILPSALVFGMFMDGASSQVPIVLGSLPTIERPSPVQLQSVKDTEVRKKALLASKLKEIRDTDPINNQQTGVNFIETKKERKEYTFQYFLNAGYTYNQSRGITENLSKLQFISGFRGSDKLSGAFGLAEWKAQRFINLKSFSSLYKNFSTQLDFIQWELNGTFRSANIRLLNTDKFGGGEGSMYIFAKHYLKFDTERLDTLMREPTGGYS